MRPFNKIFIALVLLHLATSCSNDFLNEDLAQDSLLMGSSNIYVSPSWQSSNYLFKLPSAKDADYEITLKPSWLNIAPANGRLADSIATVQCSVTKHSDFDKVGIYMDFMDVRASGRNYKIPVGYITEGNPKVQVGNTLNISFSSDPNPLLPIQNTGLGILLFGVVSMPNWLTVDTTQIVSSGFYISPYASYSLPLRFKLDNIYSGSLTGNIILSTNDKEHPDVTINVTADLGKPQLSAYTNTINFSFTETSKAFTFYNNGNGILSWEFADIPQWLTITPSKGMNNPYSSNENIIFSCDRTKLSPGQNSAIVNLKTNDSSHPSYSIKVIANAPGNTANIRAITGNIIDALFNKNTNMLYYVTSAPNKFVAYDVAGRTILNEVPLSKAPTCLAISEDWTKAAVGHNGFMSAINLSSNAVTAIYALNYSVNDIAWAKDNWFCYTQNGGSFSSLHWINAADGTSYDSPDTYSLDGNSVVKKVPNQPYLIATRNSTSPNGFFAYDIATKSKKSYAHMDLGNFWFSENGDYIFDRSSNVYRTTSSTEATNTFDADINAIGKINTGSQNYYLMQYIYHSDGYLWILKNNDPYSSDAPAASLYQVEDNDYTLANNYNYDLIYQPDAQTTPLNISGNYVFANKAGTEIEILCKDANSNSWVIQFVAITK